MAASTSDDQALSRIDLTHGRGSRIRLGGAAKDRSVTDTSEATVLLTNRIFDEINVGDSASLERIIRADDLYVFAHVSGNQNPLNMPEYDRDGDGTSDAVAPSMFVAALISAVIGNMLPGPGTLYRSQSCRFLAHAAIGDRLMVKVTVTAKEPKGRIVTLETRVVRDDGRVIAEGGVEAVAPDRRQSYEAPELPQLLVETHDNAARLVQACAGLDPLATAVVCPGEANALGGAILGAEHGLIKPILVGKPDMIVAAARELGKDISGYEIIAADGPAEAAARAVALVHDGRVAAIMKGHIHTDELLRPILNAATGLRTSRRLSHVFIMDVPSLKELLLVTDAAINIAPTLKEKVDITQNVIDLAIALGISQPRVGILSAMEVVNPDVPSTVDAAALSKMAERGQIIGGLVDGPLAMDNALSLAAARTKGITSLVAGRANILVVPNLESGNILAKQLAFTAGAEGAGLVIGARVPIMLTSRADDDKSRLVSCAVAVLYEAWRRTGVSAVTGAANASGPARRD
jgi:phosphotransacetylase/acyl dehydratase